MDIITGIQCDWPSCTSAEIFPDVFTRSHHVQNIHISDVLDNWPGSCKWPGCTSTAIFKSRKLIEIHVENIHVNPLLCTVKGCKNKMPFAKLGDLERHKASVHKIGRMFKCPRSDCPRHVNPFGRKDKLNEHIRNQEHGTIRCQYDRCISGFLSNNDLDKHMRSWEHGPIRCQYDRCKSGFLSNNDLDEHIRSQEHGTIRCQYSHCTSGFFSNNDLDKHMRSWKHGPIRCQYDCCISGFLSNNDLDKHMRSWEHGPIRCPYVSSGFNRFERFGRCSAGFLSNNALNKHMRIGIHGSLDCKYSHCSFRSFSVAGLGQHLGSEHGRYECALEGCAPSSSAFSPTGLYLHLMNEHDIIPSHMWGIILNELPSDKRTGKRTVTMDLLETLGVTFSNYINGKILECSICK
jgi:hypothetical protein